MPKHNDLHSTDPAEIEALISRLKQASLDERDAQLIERLLRTLLSLVNLLQHKNASISHLKRMLFGPRTDKGPCRAASCQFAANGFARSCQAALPQAHFFSVTST